MYEDQTFDVILQRMLSRVPETMDKRESSPIYAALAPAAVELTSMYIAFDCMLAETFGDTASREYLIRLCADRGITPKKATQAAMEASLCGPPQIKPPRIVCPCAIKLSISVVFSPTYPQ